MAKALPLVAIEPDGSFGANAPLMLHLRLAEMYGFARTIHDPEEITPLHNMRIAAKRLRYTLEIFEPCFSEPAAAKEFKAVYDRVKSIQEQIGEIHDCDVRTPAMQAFLDAHAKSRPEIRIGLERLIAKETAERERLYNKFISYWDGLQRKQFRSRFLRLLLMPEPQAGEMVENGDDADRGD